MAKAVTIASDLTSPIGRFSFCHFWEPKKVTKKEGNVDVETGDVSFETVLIIPRLKDLTSDLDRERFAELTKAYNTALKSLKEKYGDEFEIEDKNKCWEDGDKYNARMKKGGYQVRPEYEGKMILKLKSKNRAVAITQLLPTGQSKPIQKHSDFVAGDYGVAVFSVYTYDNQSRGIGFGLNGVAKVRSGPPLVGTNDADVVFKNKKVDPSQFEIADNQSEFEDDEEPAV